MKVHILSTDDWTGVFIDGSLVTEGHELWEGGDGKFLAVLRLAEKFGFRSTDVTCAQLSDLDRGSVKGYGGFPQYLNRLNAEY